MSGTLPEGPVTILFTDVVGSTQLRTGKGDEAATAILRAHEGLVREQVGRHGGREIKSLGDGFMVVFASARRAVTCAMEIQRAMLELERRDPARPVQVRIGLNTGELAQEGEDLYGVAVNAAARIAGKAKGGEILVSDVTRQLAGAVPEINFRERGRFRLKGFPERWRLHEVVWREDGALRTAFERTAFVGREEERAELIRSLEAASGGRGTLVLIGGEPGVGKTRLAEEIAAVAAEREVRVLLGRCYETESTPYIPFVEILEAALARAESPEAFRAALGDDAPDVAKLLPRLRRLFPDIPPPLELPPEQERRYLFQSVGEFVARTARLRPILLVLDDLHWADEPTLLLLEHVAQRLAEIPVLVLGTYRDVELDVARPLAKTLEELLRKHLAHRLALKRLPQAGVEAMLRALSGQDPPASLVEVVYEETEGNPFFVEEIFRHLTEEGRLFDSEGRFRSGLAIGELDVPESVRLVVGRRLERLSEVARRALAAAAVVGRDFTYELLESLGEVSPDALLDAFEEAEHARLVLSMPDGGEDRFTFAHELVRQTLITGVSAPRRRRLHLRAAEALQEMDHGGREEHAADIAHHLMEAGTLADARTAVRFLTLAGDGAMEAEAFEAALRHFENAVSLVPGEDLPARGELLFKLGLARRSLGEWDETLEAWREALSIFESLGEAETVGRLCAFIAQHLGWSYRFVEAVEMGQRGLTAMGESPSPFRVRLLATTGALVGLGGSYEAGKEMIAGAEELAEDLGDPALTGLVLYSKTAHRWGYMELSEAVETGMRAAESLRSSGDLWNLANLMPFVEFALCWMGRLEERDRLGEEAEALALRLGNTPALLFSARDLAMPLRGPGGLDDMERFAVNDLEDWQKIGGAGQIADSHMWLGLLEFYRGRFDEAVGHLEESVRLGWSPGPWFDAYWGALFRMKVYAGPAAEARALLEERRDRLPRPGEPRLLGTWTMLFAVTEGLFVLGEHEEAARLYPLIEEAFPTGAVLCGYDGRLVHTLAGIAATAGGRWATAEEHFEKSMAQAEELSHRIERPEVRRFYAQMLIERDAPGDRDRAGELLQESIDAYRAIGMPRHEEMAGALLRDL